MISSLRNGRTARARRLGQTQNSRKSLRHLSLAVEPLEQRWMLSRPLGVDVSHYQGTINWTSVKAAGRTFAWAKSTEGTGYVDPTYATNAANAFNAGVAFGPYHFVRYDLNADPQDEINTWLSVAGNQFKSGYLVPMLDVETPTSQSAATVSNWVNTFMTEIVAQTGIRPVVYTYPNYAVTKLNSSVAQWPLDFASYNGADPQTGQPASTSPWSTWTFWQYSSTTAVSGISGNVDVDSFNGTSLSSWIIPGVPALPNPATGTSFTGATLDWADAANATSYDVYLDGTFQTNVATSQWTPSPALSVGSHVWNVVSKNNAGSVTGPTWSFTAGSHPSAPTIPTPASGSLFAALPPAFNWASSVNATAYDVYLDNNLVSSTAANSWTPTGITEGTHNWKVIAKNGSLTTTSAVWTFTYDKTAPTALPRLGAITTGAPTLDIQVIYSDSVSGVDPETITDGDITVTGPNGFSQSATLISLSSQVQTSRSATYEITAPGGAWGADDNGTYTISQASRHVQDQAGNLRPAGSLGTFSYNFNWAYMSGSTLVVAFDGSATPISLNTVGSNFTATRNGATISFAAASVNALSIQGSTSDDTLQLQSAISPNLTVVSSGGQDTVQVTGGTYTFGADLGPSAANVALSVQAGASAIFNTDQHLRSLSVAGTATITPGDSVAIATKALALTGKLNLNDGAIAVDYTGTSPIGTFTTGSGYGGISQFITTGRGNGTWNGTTGIVTSMSAAQGANPLATIGVAEASTALGLASGQTTTWDGVAVDDTTVLVRYSYLGDANLDGKINGDDYFSIDNNFPSQTQAYAAGDFNYDGKINADDYFAIDNNYNKGSAPIASAPALSFAPNVAAKNATSLFADTAIPSAYDRLTDADTGLL